MIISFFLLSFLCRLSSLWRLTLLLLSDLPQLFWVEILSVSTPQLLLHLLASLCRDSRFLYQTGTSLLLVLVLSWWIFFILFYRLVRRRLTSWLLCFWFLVLDVRYILVFAWVLWFCFFFLRTWWWHFWRTRWISRDLVFIVRVVRKEVHLCLLFWHLFYHLSLLMMRYFFVALCLLLFFQLVVDCL